MNFDDFDNGMEINEIAGTDREEYNEFLDEVDATDDEPGENEFVCQEFDDDRDYEEYFDDSMDGDHDTAMRDAGWGTDEDYGFYGYDEYEPDCDLYGEY